MNILNFISSQLFILIPFYQFNNFEHSRFNSSFLVWFASTIYHFHPCYITKRIDQIIMYTFGFHILSFDFSVFPIVLFSLFSYFYIFQQNPTSLQHSLFIHLPIGLAMITQK